MLERRHGSYVQESMNQTYLLLSFETFNVSLVNIEAGLYTVDGSQVHQRDTKTHVHRRTGKPTHKGPRPGGDPARKRLCPPADAVMITNLVDSKHKTQ